MPFDGKTFREPLKTGLAGLAQLRDELRKPMPEGHRWDFAVPYDRYGCGTAGCALGLARVVWPAAFSADWFNGSYFDWSVRQFEVGTCCALTLFDVRGYPGKTYDNVTPAMVADKIDEHLKANGFSA